MSDSIDALLQLPQRKIVIAENDVFLDRHIKNDIFILMVEESIGSAGEELPASATGESSGSVASHAMVVAGAQNSLTPSSKTEIDQFDIPYSAVAMDIRLSDGQAVRVAGNSRSHNLWHFTVQS